MRRRFAGALVGALVAGSIGMAAAPAQAQEICETHDYEAPEIISMGPPVQIYVGNAIEAAAGIVATEADYAACVARNLANCIAGAAPTLPLVEVDPQTLTVTIHTQNLLGDTRCIYDPR